MTGRPPRVFTIPPGVAFVDALAQGILARWGAAPLELARVTMLLPTRVSRGTWMPATRNPRAAAMPARKRSVGIGTPCRIELPMTTSAVAPSLLVGQSWS